jgi:hypothetical protein
MTTLQMQAQKTELIGTIINNVNSEDELEAVSLFLQGIIFGGQQAPCQYSVAELNQRTEQAISDYEMGHNLISHNQIVRKKIVV